MNPLWQPTTEMLKASHLWHFMQYVNTTHQQTFEAYPALHQWSIEEPALFWKAIWDFCKVIATKEPHTILEPAEKMQDTRWFTGAALNFAENLLQHHDEDEKAKKIAIIFESEKGDSRQLSYAELYQEVSQLAAYLKQLGVKSGDRVAGCLPNLPETIIAMLATTSLGAVWSSCSPDFGLQGLVDRFGQINPVVLFAVDSHTYGGKTHEHLDKIAALQTHLPELKKTIVVPYLNPSPDLSPLSNSTLYPATLVNESPELTFTATTFDHPLYILYSSGTTGKPKCMAHSVGGTLLQHLKELLLHTNLKPEDTFFFFTTCGWMMWNWLVSGLAAGATLVLYEGSPFYPKPQRLFDLIDNVGISVFGVGAKFIEAAEKARLKPSQTHSLKTLRTILTTGSPLLPKSFDYLYQNVKPSVQVSSISGGSDIVSCFALGNPLLPVYRGELQGFGLGMNMAIFNNEGKPVKQEKGELVCLSPFPCMPIYFWNDPDGAKYQHAYFDQHPGVWTHGDYAEITAHEGIIIHGRSDTTLNPSGVRIGTAEIYQQVEKFNEVIDALAIGQNWKKGERIILFVVMRENCKLTAELKRDIKKVIRTNASPHHVPDKIIPAPDLPRTISGKLVEIAVKKIIHGEPIQNKEALANPECLVYFEDLPEIHKN